MFFVYSFLTLGLFKDYFMKQLDLVQVTQTRNLVGLKFQLFIICIIQKLCFKKTQTCSKRITNLVKIRL